MRPIKNKTIVFFCIFVDVYSLSLIIFYKSAFLIYLLMPGIILLNIFMLGEDILRSFFYDKKIK